MRLDGCLTGNFPQIRQKRILHHVTGRNSTRGNSKNPPEWGDKDIEEQQIVTDYIQDTLRHFFTRHLEIEGPITLQAGNVFHLCTFFRSDEQLPADQIDELVGQLHPTPAVCGLPKKEPCKSSRRSRNGIGDIMPDS